MAQKFFYLIILLDAVLPPFFRAGSLLAEGKAGFLYDVFATLAILR
jgi:hypothetical protein